MGHPLELTEHEKQQMALSKNRPNMSEHDIERMRIIRTNALYKAIDAISGSNARRDYADCGLTFERDGRINIVSYKGIPVAHMTPMFSRQALFEAFHSNLRSDAEYVASILESKLKEALAIPQGHTFKFDVKNECSFVESIASNKLSAYVRRFPSNNEDVSQISAEFRVFLDKLEPRAILFITRGKPFYGQHQDLVSDNQRFPKAQTYQALAAIMADTFNQVCSTANSLNT